MSTEHRRCPMCGTEYLGWATTCASCRVALVDEEANPLDLPEDQQVVYELESWSLALQAAAAEAMAESGIPHAWDGTELVVALDDEQGVDALLEAVERGEDPARAARLAAEGSESREADDDELVYELDEWSPEERETLSSVLAAERIEHRWEGEALVVGAGDEERVDAALDRVEFPDALEAEADADGGEATGGEVLSSLFLAADRLKRDPADADGIADLLEALRLADTDAPPYGVATEFWRRVVEEADALADALDAGEEHSGEVVDQAASLRDMLRPYV